MTSRTTPHGEPIARTLRIIGIAVLAVGAPLLSGRVLAATPDATKLSTLRLAYYAVDDPPVLASTLDPAIVTGATDADTIALTNANLVHILPNGQVAPDLATWTISANRRIFTFTIRNNARYSNGRPVTAADAAFSIRRALAPATNSPVAISYLGLIEGAGDYNAGKTATIAGLKVLGRRVLRITISRPVAYFLGTLSYPASDVLDPTVVTGTSVGVPDPKTGIFKNNYLTNTCVANQGAGPFKFVCRDRTSSPHSFYSGNTPTYRFKPNPYYYGHHPQINIGLPAYTPTISYRQYLAGRLDTSLIPLPFLGRWKGRSKEYHEYPSSGIEYLVPNTHAEPFNNIHCRLAVAYAIDRETIFRTITHGTVRSTYVIVPKGMLGYYPGRDNPHYDLPRARRELASCPGRTTPIVLKYLAGRQQLEVEYTAMAAGLNAIGMNVRLEPLVKHDWNRTITEPLDKTRTQLIQDYWVQDYPDPQDYCTLLLRSGQPDNIGQWQDAQYDHLVDRAEVEPNRTKRAILYVRAQHIALQQGAMIPLSDYIGRVLIKPYVHGLVGSEAYNNVVPGNLDWSNVSLSAH
ncbi:MAG: ABC transporter substrate-binding protein [Chloroflexota bacterium]